MVSTLVRFPNSLAFGSELGLHCPYRRGIFLSTLAARPIWTRHGRKGAHWVSQHHRKPHAQSQLFSLAGLAPSSRFLSSCHLQLLLEAFTSHGFPIFQQLYFLLSFATFAQRVFKFCQYFSSLYIRFLQCHPIEHFEHLWWNYCALRRELPCFSLSGTFVLSDVSDLWEGGWASSKRPLRQPILCSESTTLHFRSNFVISRLIHVRACERLESLFCYNFTG